MYQASSGLNHQNFHHDNWYSYMSVTYVYHDENCHLPYKQQRLFGHKEYWNLCLLMLFFQQYFPQSINESNLWKLELSLEMFDVRRLADSFCWFWQSGPTMQWKFFLFFCRIIFKAHEIWQYLIVISAEKQCSWQTSEKNHHKKQACKLQTYASIETLPTQWLTGGND